MPKYRTKPCEIEAIQWTGENLEEIKGFVGDQLICYFRERPGERGRFMSIKIRTLEGNMEASVGDYIIKGLAGEFYPCKPDIFEKKYELVEECTVSDDDSGCTGNCGGCGLRE